jgi:hypothetical protein
MFRINHKKAQAAIELAVFGAIVIFIIGTIVRSAAGNSYTQDQNFKAMRQAMLLSWQGSASAQGNGAQANTSRNYATVLIVEDRLSPDFGKYGDIDRNAYIANGSGTFSYELLYPLDIGVASELPVMDVYINGQHFPFTTAAWGSKTFSPPPFVPCQKNNTLQQNQCLRYQREWGNTQGTPYKLFYTMVANNGNATGGFKVTPPTCDYQLSTNTDSFFGGTSSSSACMDAALSSDMPLLGYNGQPTTDAEGHTTNVNGDMQFDLLRNADYSADSTGVEAPGRFPPVASCPGPSMRCYVAWQWAATAGTSAAMIGLNTSSEQFPYYDIDGRLKMVQIYAINPGPPASVTYIDSQAGDMDLTWDSNSYGPKPGLQVGKQIYTFTQNGTYLEIKEGKLYNPQTGQVVRSANKRDTIDLIQRTIQLSNNTHRFCRKTTPPALPAAQECIGGCQTGESPNNPVEVCVDGTGCNNPNLPGSLSNPAVSGSSCSCFSTENNIKSTCYDEITNMLFVRSRVEDQRGKLWLTGTSGQLKVH